MAIVTCAGLALGGTDLFFVLATLLVWTGSLWLVSEAPPEPLARNDSAPQLRDTMTGLVEHSELAVLMVEHGRVTVANLAARRLLGAHVIGQDVRMALRQPEAVELLGGNGDGSALVRGLAGAGDIWRINRKVIGVDVSVIEFVNRTAEADIGRAHTDFVANASHELRTPLASIIGYIETLQDSGRALDDPTSAKFLETAAREARRLQTLVDDLMSLSRIEAEKHELPPDVQELDSLVERAARDGGGPDRAARLNIASEGPFRVRCDAQQIEQLVRNLVDNAFKYGAPDGAVEVRLTAHGENRVALCVADRGDGIAPEHLPHLTRRFYRTDPGRSRASGGTGLGLAIVKHIVERHRGRLQIESRLGEGTTVTAIFPLAG